MCAKQNLEPLDVRANNARLDKDSFAKATNVPHNAGSYCSRPII